MSIRGLKSLKGHLFCLWSISETSVTILIILRPRWPRIWTHLGVLSSAQNNAPQAPPPPKKKKKAQNFVPDVCRILMYRFVWFTRLMKTHAPKSFPRMHLGDYWADFHDSKATIKSVHRSALNGSFYPRATTMAQRPQNYVQNVSRRLWSRFSWLKTHMKPAGHRCEMVWLFYLRVTTRDQKKEVPKAQMYLEFISETSVPVFMIQTPNGCS